MNLLGTTGEDRRNWLAKVLADAAYYVPPNLRPWGDVATAVNPVNDIYQSMGAAGRGDWVDSAVNAAPVVAPMFGGYVLGKMGGGVVDDAARWAEEALTGVGYNPTVNALADTGQRFAASEAGSVGADPVARRGAEIMDLLTSGRASEVTDDMLDVGDPVLNTRLHEYLFNNYDLPMDVDSRMARAGEMGFGGPWYHGTDRYFDAFNDARIGARTDAGHYGAGHYFATTPGEADYYGPAVNQYMVRGNEIDLSNNTGDLSYTGHFKSWAPKLKEIGALSVDQSRALRSINQLDDYASQNARFVRAVSQDGSEGWVAKVANPADGFTDEIVTRPGFRGKFPETKEEALEQLKGTLHHEMQTYHSEQFPGLGDEHASLSDYVRMDLGARNLTDAARQSGYEGILYGDERVVFDAKNIRSPFARFDPRLAHLRNLSAGVVPLTFGLNALATYPQSEQY